MPNIIPYLTRHPYLGPVLGRRLSHTEMRKDLAEHSVLVLVVVLLANHHQLRLEDLLPKLDEQ